MIDTEDKEYLYYGYKITRKYNYVDAHTHYIYQAILDNKKVICTSFKEIKKAIRNHLQIRD